MNNSELLLQLYDIQAIQFGSFTLRSGIVSPFYLDFRKVVSYPALLKALCEKLWDLTADKSFDSLCGVPYAAAAFASGMAILHETPMLVKRKKRKKHGTGNLLEGYYKKGDTCLVIEDIVTSGISLLDTLEELEKEGLAVRDVAVIVDRQQGGTDLLKEKGYHVHTLFTVQELLDILIKAGKIDQTAYQNTQQFIAQHYISPQQTIEKLQAEKSIQIPPYAQRIDTAEHAVTKRLLQIMERKKTNLICSADVATATQLLEIANQTGPYICTLKTHTDTLPDFTADTAKQLKAIAVKHDFLLFEDRKFCDIGHIVRQQFTSPLLAIADWADMVTVHVVAGASSVQSLKDTGLLKNKGLIIVAQMSTKDTLTSTDYQQKATKIAEDFRDCVIGIVAQERRTRDMGLLQFTPGIHLAAKADADGQTYNTPDLAFSSRGTDIIIVGRGIYKAENPATKAKEYQEIGWAAYRERNQA